MVKAEMKTKEIPEHNIERLQAIAAFLKEYRISSGYSQLEISESANLSRNSLVRMESKRPENLNILTIFAICDALELDVNQVFLMIQ